MKLGLHLHCFELDCKVERQQRLECLDFEVLHIALQLVEFVAIKAFVEAKEEGSPRLMLPVYTADFVQVN